MRLWWWRNRLRELFALPPLPPPNHTPVPARPRLSVILDRTVPGAVIRLLPAVLVLTLGALVGVAGRGWLPTVAVAVAVTWWPRTPVAPSFVLLVGLWVLRGDDLLLAERPGTFPDPRDAAVLVLCVHLLLAVTTLAEHVAWRAVVESAVLVRFARSVIGVQAVVQSLLLLVAWLRAGPLGTAAWEGLRLAAVVAVVLTSLLVLPRQWLVRRARGGGGSGGAG